MKNIRIFSLIAALFAFSATQAQDVPASLAAMLDHTLDSMFEVTGAKSLSAAIQYNDVAQWKRAAGLSTNLPVTDATTDMTYLVGSITKTITSSCILQMADEGLLHLDDSLHAYLDTMEFINPNITIRQLLQHTSGLYDVLSNPSNQPTLLSDMSHLWTAQELIDTFMQAPIAAPGGTWSYCNTNYFLLGMIIEQISGQTFYTELRERFFNPLNLSSINMPSWEGPSNLPVAHVWMDLNGDGTLEDGHTFYSAWLSLNSTAGAAGGYYSTASDISKWMRTAMRGDLYSAELQAQARTTVPAPGLPGVTYGLGLNKKTFLGHDGYGHGGDLAYSASSWYFPYRDISISVLCNDQQHTSWSLIPVVRELLRTIDRWDASPMSVAETSVDQPCVFPNPFTDTIHLKTASPLSKGAKLQLFDAMGALIKEIDAVNGSATQVIQDVAHLAPGAYTLHWTDATGSQHVVHLTKQS